MSAKDTPFTLEALEAIMRELPRPEPSIFEQFFRPPKVEFDPPDPGRLNYMRMYTHMPLMPRTPFLGIGCEVSTWDPPLIYAGLRVYENRVAFEKWEWRQARFPRSKKRRIRKKWAQRAGNLRKFLVSIDHSILKVGDTLHMHPETWRKLKAVSP